MSGTLIVLLPEDAYPAEMNWFQAVLLVAIFAMPPSATALLTVSPVRSERVAVKLSFPTQRTLRPPPGSGLICRAVSDVAGSEDASDTESETATPTTGWRATLQKRVGSASSVKERLLKASNFASMLCVLDCTILPVITVLFPLFGIVAASPAQMEFLHELGHQLALYFVLPVAGLATTLNYSNHKKLWIAALGWTGLVGVLAANVGCHMHLPGAFGHLLHNVLHTLHHGWLHKTTNLAGCGLLLFSNYMSHKQGGCKDPTCTHKH